MAITFIGSSEQATTDSTNPRTFTFDIGTRTNGGLIIPYLIFDSLAHTVDSATWNSVAMSKTAEISGTIVGDGFEVECTTGILYLAAPTDGSNTLSVTFTGTFLGTSDTTYFAPAWVDGMKQTSPLDDFGSANGDTDPSITLDPTEDNTICFAIYFSDDNTPLTSAQGTEYQTNDFGPRTTGAKYIIQTTAASQALSWTGTDADNLISAANFKMAAVAGGLDIPIAFNHYRKMWAQE